ncbi:MAG: N-formylglutamate amidohydrolase [Deltaproteobacteria bacterium]|nr:N-formylglutamate amidohydrolase [Deltaproteobacteria bacterium]
MSLPFVISIPHCSDRIPDEIKPALALNQEDIEDSVDSGTREIFGSLDATDILWARWSRLVVDLNRDPSRMDAKGVVARIDYSGRQVYRPGMAPHAAQIDERLNKYYRPYHLRLKEALEQDHIRGLLDGHSLNGIGPSEAPDAGRKRKDIVLSNNGDHNGEGTPSLGPTTCPVEILHLMRRIFVSAGFSVALNDPYTAGFITTHYGRTLAQRGKFAVQMEINQSLFIEPGTVRILWENLARTRDRIRQCFDDIARML